MLRNPWLMTVVLAVLSWTARGAWADEVRPAPPVADVEPTVSLEAIEYLEKLRKGTPFGTTDFNLDALRAGMWARNEPRIEGIKLIRLKIGEIPCAAAGVPPIIEHSRQPGRISLPPSGPVAYDRGHGPPRTSGSRCVLTLADHVLHRSRRAVRALDISHSPILAPPVSPNFHQFPTPCRKRHSEGVGATQDVTCRGADLAQTGALLW
jgi:hypothetical protein